jgi:hypothetical protein
MAQLARKIRFNQIVRLITVRFETLDATVGGGDTVEKRGFRDHAEKGNRKAWSARMIQNLSALVQ